MLALPSPRLPHRDRFDPPQDSPSFSRVALLALTAADEGALCLFCLLELVRAESVSKHYDSKDNSTHPCYESINQSIDSPSRLPSEALQRIDSVSVGLSTFRRLFVGSVAPRRARCCCVMFGVEASIRRLELESLGARKVLYERQTRLAAAAVVGKKFSVSHPCPLRRHYPLSLDKTNECNRT